MHSRNTAPAGGVLRGGVHRLRAVDDIHLARSLVRQHLRIGYHIAYLVDADLALRASLVVKEAADRDDVRVDMLGSLAAVPAFAAGARPNTAAHSRGGKLLRLAERKLYRRRAYHAGVGNALPR